MEFAYPRTNQELFTSVVDQTTHSVNLKPVVLEKHRAVINCSVWIARRIRLALKLATNASPVKLATRAMRGWPHVLNALLDRPQKMQIALKEAFIQEIYQKYYYQLAILHYQATTHMNWSVNFVIEIMLVFRVHPGASKTTR